MDFYFEQHCVGSNNSYACSSKHRNTVSSLLKPRRFQKDGSVLFKLQKMKICQDQAKPGGTWGFISGSAKALIVTCASTFSKPVHNAPCRILRHSHLYGTWKHFWQRMLNFVEHPSSENWRRCLSVVLRRNAVAIYCCIKGFLLEWGMMKPLNLAISPLPVVA